MSPKMVEVVSPKPFDRAMASVTKPGREEVAKETPDWRQSFRQESSPIAVQPSYPSIRGGYPPSASLYVGQPKSVNWGKAFGLGILVAFVGGILWGLVAVITGYIFVYGAIILGLGVGWAVKYGARRTNTGVIVITVLLTLFGVFVGDVFAFSAILSDIGVSVVDVIVNYPRIIALAPGDICLGYFFGLIGAVVAAYYLWKQRGVESGRVGASSPPAYVPSGYRSGFAQPTVVTIPPLGDTTKPVVRILSRTSVRAQMIVRLPSAVPQVVDASFEAMSAMATVRINGIQVASARVWGMQKVVEVPLDGTAGKTLKVRFFGVRAPHIEMFVDGVPVASC